MYQITENGKTIGVTDQMVFNRRQVNGCFVQCDEEQAQGFVCGGKVYSLLGTAGYPGAPVAAVTVFDGGGALSTLQGAVDDLVVSSLMGGGTVV
ncbi:MAG: hypothetical protein RRY53_08455 [Pseudoflavonifractor sp.]